MKSSFVFLLAVFGLASMGLHAQEDLPTISSALANDAATTTVHAALDAADLLPNLDQDGEMVLLAPSNDAFAEIPEGVLTKLLAPENVNALRNILANHLLGAGGDGAAEKLEMAGGSAISQIECSNGKVYVIDKVLIPSDFDPSTLE